MSVTEGGAVESMSTAVLQTYLLNDDDWTDKQNEGGSIHIDCSAERAPTRSASVVGPKTRRY